jgi:hypothetical protein
MRNPQDKLSKHLFLGSEGPMELAPIFPFAYKNII